MIFFWGVIAVVAYYEYVKKIYIARIYFFFPVDW